MDPDQEDNKRRRVDTNSNTSVKPRAITTGSLGDGRGKEESSVERSTTSLSYQGAKASESGDQEVIRMNITLHAIAASRKQVPRPEEQADGGDEVRDVMHLRARGDTNEFKNTSPCGLGTSTPPSLGNVRNWTNHGETARSAKATNAGVAGSISSSQDSSTCSSHKGTKERSNLRKGKWSQEEEEYTSRIIYYFRNGMLQLPEGTTLRGYLAEQLNCDPMRITKKIAGASCLGKRVYHFGCR